MKTPYSERKAKFVITGKPNELDGLVHDATVILPLKFTVFSSILSVGIESNLINEDKPIA